MLFESMQTYEAAEPKRRAGIGFVVGGLVLLLLIGVGFYFLMRPSGPDGVYDAESPAKTAPSTAVATTTAQRFLDAWAAQRYEDAAAFTDAPQEARLGLSAHSDDLDVVTIAFDKLAAGTAEASATPVTFHVTAKLEGGRWSHDGSFQVVQDDEGDAAVRWAGSVLHPALANPDAEGLRAGDLPGEESAVKVTAADGRTELRTYASLPDIAATIRDDSEADNGRAAHGIWVEGVEGPLQTLHVFTEERAPTVRTTIDARLQEVAEKAVNDPALGGNSAGVVALDPETGHILAIAYSGSEGNIAINAVKAPGSTMKIISAAALFDLAGLTPASQAPCPDTVLARGQTFGNDDGVRPDESMTLAEAFRVSCNTAFIKDGFNHLVNDGDASALHREASEVFGMGSWSIGGGVGTRDPSIPPDVTGGDQAAQFIGQGKVTATPLFLASVAATVRAGEFHQPIILPGTRQVPAPRPITPRTAGWLRDLMRTAATNGTAAERLGDLPGVGAKTGTAEEADHTNGWLTAYDDRIAVAALVTGGASGADTAGVIVRSLLTAR